MIKNLSRITSSILLPFFLISFSLSSPLKAEENKIAWKPWGPGIFETAKKENKLVILDLHAVWCHWCHVMEETTYRDSKVMELLQSKFIATEADQDSHLDLSNRYEDYGWPATVIFAPDGTELVKRRGYIEPAAMAALLQAVIDDPTPGPSIEKEEPIQASENAFLTPAQKEEILKSHIEFYDAEAGGWGKVLKLIEPDEMEYAIVSAARGDKEEETKVLKTLDNALFLLDPVWGGFYQYSDERDWKSPHFEKIMWVQAYYMRLYSMASAIWKRPDYLAAAAKTAGYLENFWKDAGGAFYTSQDADLKNPGAGTVRGKDFYSQDDAGRRKLGMPKIDKNIYPRDNGLAILGLTAMYHATLEKKYLELSVKAAEWILKNRAVPQPDKAPLLGFYHDEQNDQGPYLGDTLMMARAFLRLYASTGDRKWLMSAVQAADFMEKNFKDTEGGYTTAVSSTNSPGVFQRQVRNTDENTIMARFANLLGHYTGKEQYRDMAEHAMRYLASPALLESRNLNAGILLADQELASEPMHIVIVGHKDDVNAQRLFAAALQYPAGYKRLEWWDKREGAMPNEDVKYPSLPEAAAFACSGKVCSLPVFKPEKIAAQIDRLRKNKN